MARICTKQKTVYLVTKKGNVLSEHEKRVTAESKAALSGGKVVTAKKTKNWYCGRPKGK